MGMTMTQKILADHAGLDEVKAGQFIEARLDAVLANDITGPVAIKNLPDIDTSLWMHDIFHDDFTPYDPEEIEVIRACNEDKKIF